MFLVQSLKVTSRRRFINDVAGRRRMLGREPSATTMPALRGIANINTTRWLVSSTAAAAARRDCRSPRDWLRYRVAMRASAHKLHRDLPPTPLCATRLDAGVTFETRSGEAPKSSGSTNCRRSILAHRPFLAWRGAGRSGGAVGAVCTAARRRPRATVGPKIGGCRGSRASTLPQCARRGAALVSRPCMGINRLNIYAGLFGLHVIRDDVEDALAIATR